MVYVPKPAKRTKVVDGREIFKLDIPTTKEKMRHFYIKGKDSLFNNLPHPNFENISGHACCKPSECLADIMAHGRLDFRCNKKSVQSLGESPTAIELQIADNEFDCKSVFLSLSFQTESALFLCVRIQREMAGHCTHIRACLRISIHLGARKTGGYQSDQTNNGRHFLCPIAQGYKRRGLIVEEEVSLFFSYGARGLRAIFEGIKVNEGKK